MELLIIKILVQHGLELNSTKFFLTEELIQYTKCPTLYRRKKYLLTEILIWPNLDTALRIKTQLFRIVIYLANMPAIKNWINQIFNCRNGETIGVEKKMVKAILS